MVRINFSVARMIELICSISPSASGLYRAALVTPPTPARSKATILKNCVTDEVIPLYPEPKEVIIKRGVIKPQIITTL